MRNIVDLQYWTVTVGWVNLCDRHEHLLKISDFDQPYGLYTTIFFNYLVHEPRRSNGRTRFWGMLVGFSSAIGSKSSGKQPFGETERHSWIKCSKKFTQRWTRFVIFVIFLSCFGPICATCMVDSYTQFSVNLPVCLWKIIGLDKNPYLTYHTTNHLHSGTRNDLCHR